MLGIGAGVGATCYFAKKKLDELQEEDKMYYDMYAAPPYVPGPAGSAKQSAATAAKSPVPTEPVAEEEGTEPPAADNENMKDAPSDDPQEPRAPEPAAGPEPEGDGAPAGDGEKGDSPPKETSQDQVLTRRARHPNSLGGGLLLP